MKYQLILDILNYIPVSMFWKAVSTFVESSADVSMNDNPFFSVRGAKEKRKYSN